MPSTGVTSPGLMEALRRRAAARPMRVAFPEGDDETMMRAVAELQADGLAQCVLVGDGAELARLAGERGLSLEGVEIIDIADEAENARCCERYLAHPDCRYKPKGAARRMTRPLERALILQVLGDVDVMFAGIANATGDIILAAQTIVGLAEGVATVSSCGIAEVPGWDGGEGGLIGFGDSAVCVDPTPEELASIACASCDTVAALTGWEVRCALLSHSTDGSMDNALVDKVRAARDIARAARPDLAIDGEFQFDAAVRADVAAKKVGRPSDVAGRANLLIWPDINVGNIAVKIIQNLTGADAYGPMLQGFKRIVCDCSRSAPVSEIVGNVVMSCVRAQALADALAREVR